MDRMVGNPDIGLNGVLGDDTCTSVRIVAHPEVGQNGPHAINLHCTPKEKLARQKDGNQSRVWTAALGNPALKRCSQRST